MPGLLADVEAAVATATSNKSMEVAACALRGLDVTLPSALRWLRRRVRTIRIALDAVLRLTSIAPLISFSTYAIPPTRPISGNVLLWLRGAFAPQLLQGISAPLGFLPVQGRERLHAADQHKMGTDEEFDLRYVVATDAEHQRCNTSPSIRSQQSAFRRPRTCAESGVPTIACKTALPACTWRG
jgi:hypothetical protein